MRNSFISTLEQLAANDRNIVLITGDLGFGVLNRFMQKFPHQFINAGICEQNMTSLAAGLALEGKKVFTYSIANFPTLRSIEQIRNDIAYHHANVTIVSVGAGFAYGAMGMSHHATEDVGIMRALPNMTIFTPADPYETEEVTKLAVQQTGPSYLRLGKGGENSVHTHPDPIVIGKASLLNQGKDACIFVAGSIATEAVKAAEMLQKEGITCRIASFPTIKPLDREFIVECAHEFRFLVSLEEHSVTGGLGTAISEVLTDNGLGIRLIRMGLNDSFSSVVGDQPWLRKYYGLSHEQITHTIKEQLLLNKI